MPSTHYRRGRRNAGRDGRFDDAPHGPVGPRPDGARPHRAGVGPRHRKRARPNHRFRAALRVRGLRHGRRCLCQRKLAPPRDRDRLRRRPRAVLDNLPVYPSRLAPASSGGFWLTAFAARTQLVEFVLRENAYRRRMMAEIDPEYWIAPKLKSGQSFRTDAGRPHQDDGRRQTMGTAALLWPRHQAERERYTTLRAAQQGRRRQPRCCGRRRTERRIFAIAKGPGRLLRVPLGTIEEELRA